jgi:hypothetical protein
MKTFVLAVLLCNASFAWASDPAEIRPPVRLDTPEDLANLRATNPDHYARAQRVIAAANVLCPPGRPQLQSTELDSRNLSCGQAFLTSNPPKREIIFKLDTTKYAALVTITADPPKPVHAK